MKRFALVTATVLAMLLGLAIPASSSAADTTRWLTEPSCSATTTTLTCTGRAAGLQRPNNNPLGGVDGFLPDVAILGQVHYICSDPVFTFSWPGGRFGGVLELTPFHNGQTFSIEYSPPAIPPSITALFACSFGTYTRDPNYYDVTVAIGFAHGGAGAVDVLEAPIGTVLAQ